MELDEAEHWDAAMEEDHQRWLIEQEWYYQCQLQQQEYEDWLMEKHLEQQELEECNDTGQI